MTLFQRAKYDCKRLRPWVAPTVIAKDAADNDRRWREAFMDCVRP